MITNKIQTEKDKISYIIKITKSNHGSYAVIDLDVIKHIIEALNKNIKHSNLGKMITSSSAIENATHLTKNEIFIFYEYLKLENLMDDVSVIEVKTTYNTVNISLDIKHEPIVRSMGNVGINCD